MFQRLKGAIDSRIAEEQARQRTAAAQSGLPQRSTSNASRGPDLRTGSPARRTSRVRQAKDVSGEKGPDPSEFEPDVAIGGDESAAPSGTATPRGDPGDTNGAVVENTGRDGVNAMKDAQAKDDVAENDSPSRTDELPAEVRTKLRKLDRMETKYQELLRAYRIAHARIQTIEPFEATLRENTPLTSINDPSALIEYLNQTKLKTDMVLEELKRVSIEKDDYKRKSEEAGQTITSLREEVAIVRAAKEVPIEGAPGGDRSTEKEQAPTVETDTQEETQNSLKSPVGSITSRVPSLSIFSPKSKTVRSPPSKPVTEDLFSYDEEIPRLETELQARQGEISGLKKEVETLRGDLSVARESTEGMVQSLESATRELNTLRDSKDNFDKVKESFDKEVEELNSRVSDETSKQAALQNENAILREGTAKHESQKSELQEKIDSLRREFDDHEAKLVDASKTIEEMRASLTISEQTASEMKATLERKDATLKDLEDSLANAKSQEHQGADDKKVSTLQSILTTLRAQLKSAETEVADLKERLEQQKKEHENSFSDELLVSLDESFGSDPAWKEARDQPNSASKFLLDRKTLETLSQTSEGPASTAKGNPPAEQEGQTTGKKKNKKKKKGKASQADHLEMSANGLTKETGTLTPTQVEEDGRSEPNEKLAQLESQISELQEQLLKKSATIDDLHSRLKDQDSLKEEIETLRDDLLHQGEEHVEAKDRLKTAVAERKAMQETIDKLEKELLDHKAKLESGNADSQKAHQELMAEFGDLKVKATSLETDLAAAQELAATRFKDMTGLREVLSKAQPELRNLRQEVSELKSAKEDLKNKSGELRRLEARHEDLKAEMKGLGKRVGDQDVEIKTLQQKISQESSARSKVEEELKVAQSNMRTAEARRNEVVESHTQLRNDHSKAREELQAFKAKVIDFEAQLSDLNKDNGSLKEEIALKTAQHASAQSLMSSMRDQTQELSTQMREASSRADALEEELAEAQKMLTERTREGETMRRLLSDVETRAESRIREMKERLETAIEERDKAEDEASTAGRRMARELEDLKVKARDAQRALKRIEDEKEELEHSQRDWKRKREELERQAEHATSELTEIRKAMSQLRDALDESEKQTHELERQRSDLKKAQEDTQTRVERLQASNKSLMDEMKMLQSQLSSSHRTVSNAPSSRSSIELTSPSPVPRSSSVVGSPAPRDRRPAAFETATGSSTSSIDYIYLKNVLLQFLEQRDKGHQKQLIPVLGMLLKFDRKDEQRWMNAISAR